MAVASSCCFSFFFGWRVLVKFRLRMKRIGNGLVGRQELGLGGRRIGLEVGKV